MKNYYQILNVQPTATEEDIKRSYRVLAKRYHPDVNPGDKSAAGKFADINEAHDTLSDPQKRKEYDAKLKEASAPKPNPEDIIARQRAQAQAAARQAAMRGTAAARAAAYKRDPTMSITQQRAAAQAAAAAAQMANMQAAAAAQAQAHAAQVAQMNAVKNQAYTQGYERGVADGKKSMEQTVEHLKSKYEAEIQALNDKSDELYDQLAETEGDRSGLEQELFNRDRELTAAQTALKELEKRYEYEVAQLNYQIESLKNSKRPLFHGKTGDKPKHTDAEFDALNNMHESAQARIRELQTEINQAELKNKAQLQLQMDKRKQLQDEVADLRKQVDALNRELAAAKSENEQWQDYAENEQFLNESEEKLAEWDKKQKADKKLAKPTLYGSLGVLIWATDEQIDAAYAKLCKRLDTAAKGDSIEKADAARTKRAAADEAYAVLSDPQRRNDYNASIGITEARVEHERELIRENAEIEEQYRSRLDDKEFWENFDELTFNAQTGDAEAQYELGRLYYDGKEIERDADTAAYWFKEAAKQKYPDAMFMLGVCFVGGEGVDQNNTTGVGFIHQAAKLGSAHARDYMEKHKL